MPAWIRLSLGGAATLLVGMGIGRFSYTPLIPALIERGALSADQAGYVGAFNLAGYLVGALIAPRLRARFGEAPTLRAWLLVSLACLGASIVPWGFAWLAFWRFLVGVAVAVMMIYALAVVTRAAPPARLGAATGIVFTGVGAGILIAGTLVPWLLETSLAAAWTGLAVAGAAGVAVALWGWGAAAADPPVPAAAPPPPAARLRLTVPVAALIAAQTLFSLGLIPHSIYWVDYIVRGLGHPIGYGGLHWVLFGVGAVGGTYLWGRLADRIGFHAGLVLAFVSLAAAVALPVIATAGWALVVSSLVVGAQPGFSAIIAGRTHQVVGAARMARAWRLMALAAGVGQAAGGYAHVTLFSATGSYVALYFAGAACMAVGGLVGLLIVTPRVDRQSG